MVRCRYVIESVGEGDMENWWEGLLRRRTLPKGTMFSAGPKYEFKKQFYKLESGKKQLIELWVDGEFEGLYESPKEVATRMLQ